ncbi:MAG TPA: chemotaxis protein CheA [Terriglobales bacterium]|nr:chemotaxis protein CheA [Terriglobales bacterium]
MTQFSDDRGAELRELFFETAQELLQSLNDDALRLEKNPEDTEIVRSIRRIVHTLKGDAAACGFRELSELAHEFEDALAVEAAIPLTSLAEVAFSTADTFASLLAFYRGKTELPATESLQKAIRELSGSSKAKKARKSKKKSSATVGTRAVWTEYEQLTAQDAITRQKNVYHVTALIDPLCAMPIAARQLVVNAVTSVGQVLGARPEADSIQNNKTVELLVASDKTAEQVKAKCRIPTVISEVTIEIIGAPPVKAAKKKNASVADTKLGAAEIIKDDSIPAKAEAVLFVSPDPSAVRLETSNEAITPDESDNTIAAPGNPVAAENILRVDAERIDAVLNLVGELIIGKSMLQQAMNEFAKRYPKESIRGRFADAMAFQSRVLNDLQRSVMKVRMVPVEQLFRRFPRLVRDVGKLCDKKVELTISGQDTDLDKSLLDAIAEPLTHIVRNAVSHGIESAEERLHAGKPAHGTIRLGAYHQANQLIVEVRDDGKGIDPDKVKERAVRQGLVSPEEATRLSEADILEFVFRPGFSTAEEITEVSGRGVGLDVVRSVLHRLKGTVEIQTRLGESTTFRLKLPLTLAIIKALLFRVEQRLYAIPLNAVAEIARANESELHQVGQHEVLQMRNQVLPLLRMGRRKVEGENRNRGKIFVLVVSFGERKLGLIVDGMEGEEELVIKALDDQTVATDLVSGASILGDGRVVLIMNLAAIVERFSKLGRDQASGVSSGLLLSHAERLDGTAVREAII